MSAENTVIFIKEAFLYLSEHNCYIVIKEIKCNIHASDTVVNELYLNKKILRGFPYCAGTTFDIINRELLEYIMIKAKVNCLLSIAVCEFKRATVICEGYTYFTDVA